MKIGPRAIAAVAVGSLLVGASAFLAYDRNFQVDEIQNVFMARIVGRAAFAEYETGVGLFLFGPMAALARPADRSATLLRECRALFLGLFWLNVVLLGRLAGARFRSGGLVLLLGAATLAPLWDYGMEIRHDNVLLLGLLVLWSFGRLWVVRLGGLLTYVSIGLVAVLMQLVAFKAFLYAVPACAILLVCPHPSVTASRGRLAFWLVSGGLLGILAGLAFHLVQGTLPILLASLLGGVGVSIQVSQDRAAALFPHAGPLARQVVQTPLLVAGLGVFVFLALREARKERWAWFSGSSSCPEALLVASAFAAYFVNPTPFPYILVLLVPQVFLCVARLAPLMSDVFARGPALFVLGWTLILAGQLLPFLVQTVRHFGFGNGRQIEIADAAESLTDARSDRVWDGVGLVATRESIGFHWFLHSLNMSHFLDGSWPPVRAMLAERPAAAIIRNYRTDWLPREDQDFIERHYVAMSDELLVLGGRLPGGSGAWTCLHAGRYFLFTSRGKNARLSLDGVAVAPGAVEIRAGTHELETSGGDAVTIVWVGPRLERPPQIATGDHRRLFAGWY